MVSATPRRGHMHSQEVGRGTGDATEGSAVPQRERDAVNGAVRSLLIRAATLYVRQYYEVTQVLGVLDENEPAVVGERVLTWYVEVLTMEASQAIGINVTLDAFG